MKKYLFFPLMVFSSLFGQIEITSVEKLQIPSGEIWNAPVFSPNGEEVFVTNMEFNGIWEYSISSKLLKVITTDEKSGYNFVISDDGKKIAYRRTVAEGERLSRVQEVVEIDLQSFSKTVVDRGTSISTPIFEKNNATTMEKISKQKGSISTSSTQVQILGIEDQKIILLENGMKKTFDPLNQGRYIWPQLSPDRKNIVAVDMERGAFISDFEGKNTILLGKCNAPQWTRSGNWVIGMDDIDDGHRIIGSDIIAVSKDGKTRVQLTNTLYQMEMFPALSSVSNKIIVSTAAGELLLLTYTEGQ